MSVMYIHGTTASEQHRLSTLNDLTNAAFVSFLDVPAGARVLEVGSGLGLLAAAVAEANTNVTVVGLEISSEQIAAAKSAPNLTYIQGDAHNIKADSESFDLVYGRYILEHVASPAMVLREMRRVLKPGGRVVLCENDISTLRVDPPATYFERVWDAFAQAQLRLGGDPFVGRKLFRLAVDAGFRNIELSLQPEVHWSGSPGFREWMFNLEGNIHGAQDTIELMDAEIEAAIEELRLRLQDDRASCVFAWNRAVAVK